MKKAVALMIILVFAFATVAMAGYDDKCAKCHNGKTAPDKAKMLEKSKTAADFVKAAEESKSPMMKSFKDKADELKAAAAELGLK
ncbi:MAG: hypothetical protein HQK88_11320 [Nitrospirae bacterium]|nr:hypothetical protein [Nitrospirota bacterium]MBF0518849.1 hypothetical protein [Nitrospirota bacterium]MBF0535477.1 hypothetical protein [Nitrospirota bacterium]MBF0617391.1 hypothetical protein [Nitrospirota bacterium]